MIDFMCLECGEKMQAPESAAGLDETCPACRKAVTVPKPLPAEVPPAVARPRSNRWSPPLSSDSHQPAKAAAGSPAYGVAAMICSALNVAAGLAIVGGVLTGVLSMKVFGPLQGLGVLLSATIAGLVLAGMSEVLRMVRDIARNSWK